MTVFQKKSGVESGLVEFQNSFKKSHFRVNFLIRQSGFLALIKIILPEHDAQQTSIQVPGKDFVYFSNGILFITINEIGVIQSFI